MNNIYNPEYVKNLFNRMSSSYERMNYITSFGFSIRWRKNFLKSFNKTEKEVEIIDLLTGMGETWKATKHKFPKSKLSALDFSEGMLKYAETKNNNKFNNKVNILNQDILNNELQSNYFDFVTCAFGLKTFNEKQLEILASQTNRILKPNGKISFIEVSEPRNKVLKMFYEFYLKKIIPILGKVFLGNPIEYKMLWEYTNKFKNSKKAMEIFAKEGFELNYNSYFYGCATGFNGTKIEKATHNNGYS